MGLIDTIICYITWAVVTTWSYGVDALTLIMTVVVLAINLALAILPQATLPEPELESSAVGLLNYIVNVGLLLDVLGLLIGMTLLWKLYKWLLKFVQ